MAYHVYATKDEEKQRFMDEEAAMYPVLPVSQALPANFYQKTNESILVKAKWHNRFKQFYVPANFPHRQLVMCLKENFGVVEDGGVHVTTAYLLWLCFGWLGIHRFYLKQHNATSFWIWFLTGQLFGLGWLYDGLVLWNNVKKFNRRMLYPDEHHDEGCFHFLFGFKETERPSAVGAYILWFFMGWAGVHRWYTGHATPSSFLAWFCTGQICGLGWCYDAVYTMHLVNYPKMAHDIAPFFIKVYDHQSDYLPVNDDQQLGYALQASIMRPEKTIKILVVEKYSQETTYLLWTFFGILGGHAWYLDLGSLIIRFFTGNYFFFGWVVEGIRMEEIVDDANRKLAEQYIPSYEGRKSWPGRRIISKDF